MFIVDLRLQLLEPEKYPYLFKCLYGLLMLLPQSSAFVSLRNRLNAVNSAGFLHIAPKSWVISLFLFFHRGILIKYFVVMSTLTLDVQSLDGAKTSNGKNFLHISVLCNYDTRSYGGAKSRQLTWTVQKRPDNHRPVQACDAE